VKADDIGRGPWLRQLNNRGSQSRRRGGGRDPAAVRVGGELLDSRAPPGVPGVLYGHHLKIDENAREQYRGRPYFDRTAEFCALYDEVSFDAGYAGENTVTA
jgi:hypothetical protein